MKPAALAGTYHNLRPVMGRKVFQVHIELPIEQMPAFVAAFGAPNPDTWIAIARLEPGREVVQAERSGPEERMGNSSTTRHDTPPRQIAVQPSGGAQRRGWADLSPAQQAGIICRERPFWRFLSEQGTYRPECAEDAAEAVRAICGVSSRRDIGENHHAPLIWATLVDAYRAWQKAPECVP